MFWLIIAINLKLTNMKVKLHAQHLLTLFLLITFSFSSFAQIESFQNGNWNSPSTLVGNVVPTSANDVIIQHEVSNTNFIATFNNLTIDASGIYNGIYANTLSGLSITNNGIMNLYRAGGGIPTTHFKNEVVQFG
jgi:hypothetical protein